jgi:hypothetical protein
MSTLFNDADYIELTIKCLFRDKQVLNKAIDLGVRAEDFGTINIYNAFVETALAIGDAPVNPQLCLSGIKSRLKEHNILQADMPTVLAFWEYVYNEAPLSAEYVLSNLAEFIKFRRYQSLKISGINNPEELVSEANKLVGDIDLKNTTGGIREFNPFEELVTIEHRESLMTGFPAIDMVAKGLNYQELGLILGHSGSGKTAMAAFSAIQNAKQFRKVLYLSLEEPAENICNRVYSNTFRIPYTDLHKGSCFAKNDLRAAFSNMCERDKAALLNLKIHDLRDATPITAKYIQNYLDQLYENTGYHPDLVYIDQMDYLTTKDKFDAEWQKYAKVAFEVDDLCNHLIGGQHMFSVWLLHQASGKMTRKFTNAEISGFKGILKPVDMALAIGRDSSQDSIVSIFSLKSRHAKNFQFDYLAELEFMNFEQKDRGAEDRAAEEDKDKKKVARGNFNYVPPKKAGLLPAAGTGFA